MRTGWKSCASAGSRNLSLLHRNLRLLSTSCTNYHLFNIAVRLHNCLSYPSSHSLVLKSHHIIAKMQVINVRTNELVYFPERPDHPYAILSHTWEEGEVSLQAFKERKNLSLPGHQKIAKACHLASLEGYDYIWIDTCCIDKTSSAELSEAINSMFKWYQQAQVCYAYLSDYEHGIPVPWQKGLRGCRWVHPRMDASRAGRSSRGRLLGLPVARNWNPNNSQCRTILDHRNRSVPFTTKDQI